MSSKDKKKGAPSVYAHFLDMYFSDTVNYLIVATVISLTATSLFTLFYRIESQAPFIVWSAFQHDRGNCFHSRDPAFSGQ